jgi:subtilase family serine protease
MKPFSKTICVPRRRWARLRVEELESRDLLSAVEPVVQPMLAVEPFALNGQTPYSPAQIANAYAFNQIAFSGLGGRTVQGDGSGETIAIVEMYDDPAIASDLHIFDQRFGLPDSRLIKVAPQGNPGANTLWALETSLDVEWAHALAPRATILLVEARGSTSSLLNAINYARNYPGVCGVSMSFGDPEFSGESYYDSYFTTPAGHTPITFIASSGDYGASQGPCWPAISKNVLGVGGTTLYLNSAGNYSSETGWSNSTGGYSGYRFRYTSYVPEPAYQQSAQHSGYRTSPDVAFDANRSTGYWIYDSVGSYGWAAVGGTSAGPPQWSALVAIADQGRALAGHAALASVQADVYSLSAGDFHDITRGNNGYTAHAGYDVVTGLGSPIANLVVHDLVTAELPSGHRTGTMTTTATGVTVTLNITINAAAVIKDEPVSDGVSISWIFPSTDIHPVGTATAPTKHVDQVIASADAAEWWRTTEMTLGRRPEETDSRDLVEASVTEAESDSYVTTPVFIEDAR